MPTSLYTNGQDTVCVIHPTDSSRYLAYKLIGNKLYGFTFYRGFYPFPLHLQSNAPLIEQPFGKISSVADLTGRMNNTSNRPMLSSQGKHRTTLDVPLYSLVGGFAEQEISKLLEGYRLADDGQPYAVMSVKSRAVAMQGEDLYKESLIFTTGPFVLHAQISANAGRADEDCCSLEYYFEAEKLRNEDAKPPQRLTQKEMMPGAFPLEWSFSVGDLVPAVTVKYGDSTDKIIAFDALVNSCFNDLKHKNWINVH